MWSPRHDLHRKEPASEILPGLLWLGGTVDAFDEVGMRKLNICTKLNVRTTKLRQIPGIEQLWHPLVDWWGNTPEKFMAAVDKLDELMKKKVPTLVHCHMGVSRSPSIVATWWAKDQKLTFDHSLDIIRRFRPFINPFEGVRNVARYSLGEIHASSVCVNCAETIYFDRNHPYSDYEYTCESCGWENTVRAFQYPDDSNS